MSPTANPEPTSRDGVQGGLDYPMEFEITSKSRADHQSAGWTGTELPCAPAVMIAEKVVVEGSDISEEDLVALVRQELRLTDL
jgi:hypothetical protein